MHTPRHDWWHALITGLSGRNGLPLHLGHPTNQEVTPELERHLEREIARRLGRRHPRATT